MPPLKADGTLDSSDAFDLQLAKMQRQRVSELEINAAIALYDRLRTSRAIAVSFLNTDDTSVVLALLAELCADCRAAAVLAGSKDKSMY